jgi:hypothetical protein
MTAWAHTALDGHRGGSPLRRPRLPGPWRMQHQVPRVRGMRYLLAMMEAAEPVLTVVLNGEAVCCWRLCGL